MLIQITAYQAMGALVVTARSRTVGEHGSSWAALADLRINWLGPDPDPWEALDAIAEALANAASEHAAARYLPLEPLG